MPRSYRLNWVAERRVIDRPITPRSRQHAEGMYDGAALLLGEAERRTLQLWQGDRLLRGQERRWVKRETAQIELEMDRGEAAERNG